MNWVDSLTTLGSISVGVFPMSCLEVFFIVISFFPL